MISAGVSQMHGYSVSLALRWSGYGVDYDMTSEEANNLVRQIQQALQYAGAVQ
jgi:hypothetical protein